MASAFRDGGGRYVEGLAFELARIEHAVAIAAMRRDANDDLAAKLGPGNWSGATQIQSIRDRIKQADPHALRRLTLYVACRGGIPVGSIGVSTWPPGFWKRQYWSEPRAAGLGVFGLVVAPRFQRHGYGRFLMDAVERLAHAHQIPFVRLDAYLRNPFSNAFYQAIGYDQRATIDLRGTGLVLYERRVVSL